MLCSGGVFIIGAQRQAPWLGPRKLLMVWPTGGPPTTHGSEKKPKKSKKAPPRPKAGKYPSLTARLTIQKPPVIPPGCCEVARS